jgi:hypothetical protein
MCIVVFLRRYAMLERDREGLGRGLREKSPKGERKRIE